VDALDVLRLRGQHRECAQLSKLVRLRRAGDLWRPDGRRRGYVDHPAVLMWAKYPRWLDTYWWHVVRRLEDLGTKVRIRPQNHLADVVSNHRPRKPWWLGVELFHSSHRALLLWKNYDHYIEFKWRETPCHHRMFPGALTGAFRMYGIPSR
jgi:hypothetical protein